jgi:hypothetical protein
MGSFYTEQSTPPAHRTGLFRPTTALPMPSVGVPASPWMWAKARSKLGALIRLSVRRRGGVKRGENKWGHPYFTRKKHPSCTQNRAVPTHHRTPDAPRWRSRLAWMWAKARSNLGALIRLCGDGAVSNEAKMGSFYTEQSTPPAHRTGLFRPTTALPTPPVGVPASPWMWAKARS